MGHKDRPRYWSPAHLLVDLEQFMRPADPMLSMDRNTQVFSFQNVQPKIIIL
jgi:hypothetical protein